ncbi:hypothetical protein BWK59_14530, partial [Flavobacterium davisii]
TTLTKVAATYNKYMKELGMNTCWNKAHFFAQARVESGSKLHVKDGENFNYYWEILIEKFGAFQTSEGKQKAKLWGRAIKNRRDPKCVDVTQENQRKIANYAYSPPAEKAKELENTQPNDGWNFRGKGLLQLTGRNAYTYANTYTKKEGADIIANPDLVISDVSIAVLSSMAFWKWKNLNTKANLTKDVVRKICPKVGSDTQVIDESGKSSTNHKEKKKVFDNSTSKVFKIDECKLGKAENVNNSNCICKKNHIDLRATVNWQTQFDPQWGNRNAQNVACWKTAQQILTKSGLGSLSGYPANAIQLAKEIENHTKLSLLSEGLKKGIQYIDSQLESKHPVLIGVNHDLNYRGEKNIDHTSDHFVVVVGRSCDTKGAYYIFYEVGTSHRNLGTSDENKLYILTDKIEGKTAYNSSKTYQVAQVRLNK